MKSTSLRSHIRELINRRRRAPHNNLPNPHWHRDAVGGYWEEMGKLQFSFLLKQGLRSEQRFLDIGCGCLRGGLHSVEYLQTGHYFGIDIDQEILDAGRKELTSHNLSNKRPVLVQMDDFDFSKLGQNFDYALAQSVFTHLPLNNIIRCIVNVEKVLVQGGRFYATFFENPQGKFNLDPVMHPRADLPDFPTYFDKDPYHYDFETFKSIVGGTKLNIHYLGLWNHPWDQRMMVFEKL
jgi:SAM-dependent methyltransferase